MRALLLVDIQNDFMPTGRLPVPEGDAIIAPVNALIGNYPLVVATQDWHPQNHESFASAHPGKKPFDVIDLHGLEQILWPDHCVAGTSGADFHPKLDTRRIAAVFRKGMDKHIDSYSAFYDNGCRHNTHLADYLHACGVTDIDVVGLAADFCVYFSIMDALAAGFRVRLIESCTRPIDKKGFFEKKAHLQAIKGFVLIA